MNRAIDQPQPNPLREGLSPRGVPQPCSIVIFGATGDLTQRKLIPRFTTSLPMAICRPPWQWSASREETKLTTNSGANVEEATRKFSRQPVRDEIWKTFAQSIFYHQSEFADASGYKKLVKRLDEIDNGTRYARQPAFLFRGGSRSIRTDSEALKSRGFKRDRKGSWARVIVEKPFGSDLASARELNQHGPQCPSPKSRPTASIIISARKPRRTSWSCDSRTRFSSRSGTRTTSTTCRSQQRKRSEWKTRAGFYERAGALRDMVQNHLLQLLCLVAMEPPTDLSADSIRDEKVKVVRSLRRLPRNEVVGQCRARAIHRRRDQWRIRWSGIAQEQNVKPESQTETFVARVCSSTTGAGPMCRFTCVSENAFRNRLRRFPSISKKRQPFFSTRRPRASQNVLVIRIQPDEGISLRIQAKMPGREFSHRAGENGFPLRNVLWQGQPGGIRTAAARCDELATPRSLRVATKWRKPGLSSIRSRKRGTQKKMRLVCFSIPPDPGARKKPMICWRVMAGHGGDYEL